MESPIGHLQALQCLSQSVVVLLQSRHSFVPTIWMTGDLLSLMNRLGPKSLATTQRYAHQLQGDTNPLIGEIGKLLGFAEPPSSPEQTADDTEAQGGETVVASNFQPLDRDQ